MELLCIGINGEVEAINSILNKKISVFDNEDLYIERKMKKVGDTTYLSYFVNNDKNSRYNNIRNIFKHYAASGISDVVLNLYQEKIIERVLENKCFYLDIDEKAKIRANVLEYLNNNDYVTAEDIMYKISKRAKILKAILEFLDFSNEINIDGFVNFRLRFFTDIIEDAIDKTIEDLFVEREYKEFVKILQYFVDIQTPKIELINVVLDKEKFSLYDGGMKVIKNEFIEEFADEMFENNMDYNDVLISSLITIAPKKIVMHVDTHNKDNQVIQVIQSIFDNKSTICEGCELCKSSSASKVKGKVNKEK